LGIAANLLSPPGRLVDIGGYRLHLDCQGTGSPTVILEAGLGDPAISWSGVQPALARSARVCSYDRAGLGSSDPGPFPRDPMRETGELHTLLSRAGLAPPYVLVGHSYGGDLTRLYAARFPQGVVGLVLVEAANEDQWWKIPEARTAWDEYLRECRKKPKDGPATCGEAAAILDQGPAELRPIRSLGSLPLIVVSAGKSFWGKAATWAAWQAMQASDSALSSCSDRVIAAKSQHEVEKDEPQIIVDQVERMLKAIRDFPSV
jgi:pimeloyl-ACP methyl ester carboxylesterase